jgi:hypothetical protein
MGDATTPVVREGGCVCGAVRYRVSGEPLTVYVCHCSDCQRHGGSAFAISMVVRKTDLALVRGEPRAYSVRLEGRSRNGRFCGECATRLWGEPERYPQIAVVRPGTLDDTSWLRPVAHIWTRSAQPWVNIADGPYDCEGQPPDSMAMIRAWREREGKRS